MNINENNMSISIIGYSRFGKLLHEKILNNKNVIIYDVFDEKYNNEKNFLNAAQCNIIFICVPILKFKKLLIKLSKVINKQANVIDVLSVKEYPNKLMDKYLPQSVSILPSHPMF